MNSSIVIVHVAFSHGEGGFLPTIDGEKRSVAGVDPHIICGSRLCAVGVFAWSIPLDTAVAFRLTQ